jgi:ketosteroid isomerase-like protein
MSTGSSRSKIVRKLTRLMAAEDAVIRMNDPALFEEAVEAIRQVAAPDFVFALVTPATVGGARAEYAGVEGFVAGWQDWLGVFDSFQVERGEQIEAADKVISMVRTTAIPKGTTAAIEGRAAGVFTFDGDRISRMEFNLDQEAVLRAAGLKE